MPEEEINNLENPQNPEDNNLDPATDTTGDSQESAGSETMTDAELAEAEAQEICHELKETFKDGRLLTQDDYEFLIDGLARVSALRSQGTGTAAAHTHEITDINGLSESIGQQVSGSCSQVMRTLYRALALFMDPNHIETDPVCTSITSDYGYIYTDDSQGYVQAFDARQILMIDGQMYDNMTVLPVNFTGTNTVPLSLPYGFSGTAQDLQNNYRIYYRPIPTQNTLTGITLGTCSLECYIARKDQSDILYQNYSPIAGATLYYFDDTTQLWSTIQVPLS